MVRHGFTLESHLAPNISQTTSSCGYLQHPPPSQSKSIRTHSAPSSKLLALKQLLKPTILNRAEMSLLIALRAHKDKYLFPRINRRNIPLLLLKQDFAVIERSGDAMQLSVENKKSPDTLLAVGEITYSSLQRQRGEISVFHRHFTRSIWHFLL